MQILKAAINERCKTSVINMITCMPECGMQYYVCVPGSNIFAQANYDSIRQALRTATRTHNEVVYNYDGTALVIYEFCY